MKKVKKIKSNFLTRNLDLAKLALKSGSSLVKNFNKDPENFFKDLVSGGVEELIEKMSVMKGSVLKGGQLLTLYGEYYLPKEVNEKLKLLQNQTHYLDWQVISKSLDQRLLDDFEIDPNPIGAASIGQVHLGKNKNNGKKYAIKIQYEGIDKAITTDILFLKTLFSMANIVPKGMKVDKIFEEIKEMLINEMDYKREAEFIAYFHQELVNQEKLFIPKTFDDYCSEKVLVVEYVDGFSLGDEEALKLDQEKRDTIGEDLIDLFFKEIFKIGVVQSDAHGGNYIFERNKERLALIDFGASKKLDSYSLDFYQSMLRDAFHEDKESFLENISKWNMEMKEKVLVDLDVLWKYLILAVSPLKTKDFDWENTDLPDKLYELGKEIMLSSKIKEPPYQFIFLDRKVLGLFAILRSLKVRTSTYEMFKSYIS